MSPEVAMALVPASLQKKRTQLTPQKKEMILIAFEFLAATVPKAQVLCANKFLFLP